MYIINMKRFRHLSLFQMLENSKGSLDSLTIRIRVNPLSAKLTDLNFHSLEVVCRYSDPQSRRFERNKMLLPRPLVKLVGSLCDWEVACSTSDHTGLNLESWVWRTVSSNSSHHPQKVILTQFSLYVHKSGLKPDLFHLPTTSNGWKLQIFA